MTPPTANEVLGNVLNVSILAAGLTYAACIVYFTQPGREGLVDEGWKEDGFCVQNKDVPYWSSFDTCLYVDFFFSAVLGLLYLSWRSLPGMEYPSRIVPMVIASTVAHGLAHGAMAQNFRNSELSGFGSQELEDVPSWKTLATCVFFWFPLLKAALQQLSNRTVAILAVVATYGPSLVGEIPVQHQFAYVQTVVTVAFHTSQLLLNSEEKQRREYVTLPLIAAIPPIVTSWNEALACTAYFRTLGGHMLYDASIILGFLAYYVDSYRYYVQDARGQAVIVPTKDSTKRAKIL